MTLNYCPECAAPLVQENLTRYTCENGHPYWNNPRAGVAIVLLRGDEALFAKRGNEPHKGKYDFPGGFLEYNENAIEAMKRELQEETGVTLNKYDLISSAQHEYVENMSVCDTICVCTSWQGTPKPADDVAALEWKPIEFIESEEFAWDYSGLVAKLKQYQGS